MNNTLSNDNPVQGPIPNQPSEFSRTRKNWMKLILLLLTAIIIPPFGVAWAIYMLLKRSLNWRLLLRALLIAVISLASITGYFFVWKYYNPTPYHLTSLSNKELTAKLEGAGMSYKVPEGFELGKQSVEFGSSVANYLLVNKSSQPVKVPAVMAVASRPSALAASQSYIESLSLLMSKHQGTDYEKAVAQPVKQFLHDNLLVSYDIALGQPSTFASSNISKNAWQFDFTGKIDGQRQGNGKFVLAVGKETFYYLMVASVDYNWEPNKSIWQQILDSLKIDQ